MNIVKLKDEIMPNTFKMADFFNKHLKGKYAYWIQMRYIFALDSMDYELYIKYEQLDAIDFLSNDILPHIDLYSEEYCMIDFAKEYIDLCTTEEVNNIYNFLTSNVHSTDEDLNIDSLRRFRSWLATELLKLNKGINIENLGKYSTEQLYMLEYYKNNMYNETIKHLEMFGNSTVKISGENNRSCGCCNNISNSLYDSLLADNCNVISIYRSNIHDTMVKMFESPDFWINLNTDFVKVVKKYVDNIIKVGFTINNDTNKNPFTDCVCKNDISVKNSNDSILNNLSIALGYIVEKKYTGHINFIHDSLYNWAEYLYDKMYWEVNK